VPATHSTEKYFKLKNSKLATAWSFLIFVMTDLKPKKPERLKGMTGVGVSTN